MVKVHLNNLAVIVGTACNLKCKHCLGGNPNKHMVIQEKYINDLTPNITGIDELSFIGYEDTLYIAEMKMIFDKLLSAGIKINRFTAFTNAVDYSQDLIEFYNHYKNYVIHPNKISLHLSNDPFHYNSGFTIEQWKKNAKKYIQELNLDEYAIQQFNNTEQSDAFCEKEVEAATLMIQGRAKQLGKTELAEIERISIPVANQTNFRVNFREKCEGKQNTCNNGNCICNCIVDEIVLTPNGYIFMNDAMAFNAIDTDNYIQAIGHISETSLFEMVQRKNEEYNSGTKDKIISVVFKDESNPVWRTHKLIYDYLFYVEQIIQSVDNSNISNYKNLKEKTQHLLSEYNDLYISNGKPEDYTCKLYQLLKLDFNAMCEIADNCFTPYFKNLLSNQLKDYHKNTSPFGQKNFREIVGVYYNDFKNIWQCYYEYDFDNYAKNILSLSKHKPTIKS
jgi:hypothetical protein